MLPIRTAAHALIASGAIVVLAVSAGAGGQSLQISEIRVEQFPGGDDVTEYFELAGEAGHPLVGYTYVVLGDDVNVIAGGDTNSGVIEAIIPLEGALDADGRWLVAQPGFPLATPDQLADLNFEDVDNVTHLLVTGFEGVLDADLDADDDGVLEVQPWTAVIDAVGLLWVPPSGFTGFGYGGVLGFEDLGPNFDNLPQHVYRGGDCGEWVIDYDANDNDDDTPGMSNLPCPPDPPPFGLAHDPLGEAVIKAGKGGVEVSNIGASGDDGVLIQLGAAEGWLGAIDFGAAGDLATGSSLTMKAMFVTGETPNQASLTLAETRGGQAAVSFAADVCDPCALTVEALLQGEVVDSVSHAGEPIEPVATGEIGTSGDVPPTLRSSLTKLDGEVDADMALLLSMPSATPLTLAGSGAGAVLADALRLGIADLPAGLLVDNRVELTAANIESFTLSDEALLQFQLEHRGVGEALLTGDVDPDGGPDLLVGNLDSQQTNDGVSIRPPATELLSSDANSTACCTTPQAVVLEPLLPSEKFYSSFSEWLVYGRFANGNEMAIMATQYYVLANGEVIFFLVDGPWVTGTALTWTGLLDGETVAEWSFGSLWVPYAIEFFSFGSLRFDILPSDASATGSYRATFRWNEPLLIEVPEGLVLIDQLQVTGVGTLGADGAPTEVSQTTLIGNQFFKQDDIVIRIKDVAFLPGEACLADLTGDCAVGPADLAALLATWGACPARGECPADLAPPDGGDDIVGPADLAALLAAWGPDS